MMTDYIKRDALLEARELAICAYENAGVFNADAIRNHLKPLLDAVVDTPAADVAEVVRCKDCKHRTEYGNCGHPRQKSVLPSAYPFDFCSYGKRREGDNDNVSD